METAGGPPEKCRVGKGCESNDLGKRNSRIGGPGPAELDTNVFLAFYHRA